MVVVVVVDEVVVKGASVVVVVVVVDVVVGGGVVVLVVEFGLGSGGLGSAPFERTTKIKTIIKMIRMSINPKMMRRRRSSNMRHLCSRTSTIVILIVIYNSLSIGWQLEFDFKFK